MGLGLIVFSFIVDLRSVLLFSCCLFRHLVLPNSNSYNSFEAKMNGSGIRAESIDRFIFKVGLNWFEFQEESA